MRRHPCWGMPCWCCSRSMGLDWRPGRRCVLGRGLQYDVSSRPPFRYIFADSAAFTVATVRIVGNPEAIPVHKFPICATVSILRRGLEDSNDTGYASCVKLDG